MFFKVCIQHNPECASQGIFSFCTLSISIAIKDLPLDLSCFHVISLALLEVYFENGSISIGNEILTQIASILRSMKSKCVGNNIHIFSSEPICNGSPTNFPGFKNFVTMTFTQVKFFFQDILPNFTKRYPHLFQELAHTLRPG